MSNSLRAFFIVLTVALFAAIVYVVWSVALTNIQESPTPTSTPSDNSSATDGYDPGPREAWKAWTDNDFDKATNTTTSYSIKSPRDFEAREGDQAGGGNFIGEPRVSLNFPDDAFDTQETNFAGGAVVVSIAKAATAATCYQDPQNSAKTLTDTETINGVSFKAGVASDAGAGNFYDSRVYRALYGGNCYELVSVVHTTNVGNYEPGTVTEFNKAQAWSVLDRIVRTMTLSTSSQQ